MAVNCIFWLVISSLTLVNAKIVPFIVGGYNVVNRADFPYQASIRFQGSHICGGTIINNNTVLSAAHCCYNNDKKMRASDLTIVVGGLYLFKDNNAKTYEVSKFFVHEKYFINDSYLKNDISAFKIVGTFEPYTDFINFINTTISTPEVNENCTVSGWGTTEVLGLPSNDLKAVQVPVVDYNKCKAAYGVLDGNVLCAGKAGKDSCTGDSGGPLVCDGKLAGIVSYGFECALPGFPGVYTDVSKYSLWIEEQKKKSSALKNTISGFSIAIIFSVLFL